MRTSMIVLGDSGRVRLDDRGRSRAYFCLRKPVGAGQELIVELKALARTLGGWNVRVCLHESPEATFHDMIILEHRGRYYRPHKHTAKGETYHMIEGEMAAFAFADDGAVTDACRLSPQGNFVYRVGADMYHAVMPLTDVVIYHESKPGPFTGDTDSIYPPWAPAHGNQDDAGTYTEELLRLLRG